MKSPADGKDSAQHSNFNVSRRVSGPQAALVLFCAAEKLPFCPESAYATYQHSNFNHSRGLVKDRLPFCTALSRSPKPSLFRCSSTPERTASHGLADQTQLPVKISAKVQLEPDKPSGDVETAVPEPENCE